jgi:hypothetical protein
MECCSLILRFRSMLMWIRLSKTPVGIRVGGCPSALFIVSSFSQAPNVAGIASGSPEGVSSDGIPDPQTFFRPLLTGGVDKGSLHAVSL